MNEKTKRTNQRHTMKSTLNKRRPALRFERETPLGVEPLSPEPFRGVFETELERLKEQLLRETLDETGRDRAELSAPLRRASNEAAALAWTTPFPLLLLPELFREKAEAARRYVRKQAVLRTNTKRRTPVIGQAA
jgi:hypothetical protein